MTSHPQHLYHGLRYRVRLDSRANHVSAGNATDDGWAREQHLYVIDCYVPGIWTASLRISGAKGIRAVFIACAGVLAVISAAGYFLMRTRTHPTATADVTANGRQSSAANPQR
jgi:hypothetical protein